MRQQGGGRSRDEAAQGVESVSTVGVFIRWVTEFRTSVRFYCSFPDSLATSLSKQVKVQHSDLTLGGTLWQEAENKGLKLVLIVDVGSCLCSTYTLV